MRSIQSHHCGNAGVKRWTATDLRYKFWNEYTAECSDVESAVFSSENVNQRRRHSGKVVAGISPSDLREAAILLLALD